mgnify:CR=1 FL=1
MRRRRIRQTLIETSYVYNQWEKENGGLSEWDGLIPEIVKSEAEPEEGEGEEEQAEVVESKNSIIITTISELCLYIFNYNCTIENTHISLD